MKRFTALSTLVLSLALISHADVQAAAPKNDLAQFSHYTALSSLYPCELKKAIQYKAIGPTFEDMICTEGGCSLPPAPTDKLVNFQLVSLNKPKSGDLLLSFPSKTFDCDMQSTVLTSSTLPARQDGRFYYLLRAK
jgi:hypothetical protein